MKLKAFIKTHKLFCVYLVLALILVIVAIAAPVIATHDPYEAVFTEAMKAPSSEHICGTDTLGRDLFSRIVYGTRVSLKSTFILIVIVFVIGTALGIISGAFGGVVDTVIMRVADTMLAFPDLILAMAIAGILGANIVNSMVAIAAVSWTKYARMARSLVLKIKNREFISAAKVTGSSKIHTITNYFLPNVMPTMIITVATDVGTILLSLSSLSFLGFGVQPPTPEWGYMLSEGRNYLQSAPWLLVYPGIAIFITVIVFNLLGDSVRDILDPKSKRRRRKRKKLRTF